MKLFGLVPVYGLLIICGIIAAYRISLYQEKEKRLPKDFTIDLIFWLLPFGVIGARIYYVAFRWDYYMDDPLRILYLWEGGLAIYGAVIGGAIGMYIFTRRKKIPFLKAADTVAPGLVLAQAIGRWGNYFNREAFGREITNKAFQFFPVAVPIDGSWFMATFFYESCWDLFCFLMLWRLRKKCTRDGSVFALYFIFYGFGRAVIEGLRTDSLMWGSVRVSQALSVFLIAAGIVLLLFNRRKARTAAEDPADTNTLSSTEKEIHEQ